MIRGTIALPMIRGVGANNGQTDIQSDRQDKPVHDRQTSTRHVIEWS
jgi:hypothetical protein